MLLEISPQNMLNRRKQDQNRNRLPMKDDVTEGKWLHQILEMKGIINIREEFEDLQIPTL